MMNKTKNDETSATQCRPKGFNTGSWGFFLLVFGLLLVFSRGHLIGQVGDQLGALGDRMGQFGSNIGDTVGAAGDRIGQIGSEFGNMVSSGVNQVAVNVTDIIVTVDTPALSPRWGLMNLFLSVSLIGIGAFLIWRASRQQPKAKNTDIDY